jgi:UDP-N-acetylglucosamine 2-epimerase (non-hydrolysing)
VEQQVIHVFIGTKAQYIKTAPLMRLMDERSINYRLIDTGQHAEIASVMRVELEVREPDLALGGKQDVATIGDALRWAIKIASRLWSGRRVRDEIFGGQGGVCVVHGDTPSTLLSSMLAWRAGLTVAHLEAGLRSQSLLHPFPEELIRIVVMRLADVCFAPTPDAVQNLERIRRRGRVVPLDGNTSIEAVAFSRAAVSEAGRGPAIVTMHRVENLNSVGRVRGFIEVVVALASRMPTRFVMHEPTRLALEKHGTIEELTNAGVEVGSLVGHGEFMAMLAAAPLAIIDGGSIQEECAYLGVPTLLWREKTERLHGVGANVVLSGHEQTVALDFIERFEAFRRPPALPDVRPSELILSTLLEMIR